jgi:hypothetical protein
MFFNMTKDFILNVLYSHNKRCNLQKSLLRNNALYFVVCTNVFREPFFLEKIDEVHFLLSRCIESVRIEIKFSEQLL